MYVSECVSLCSFADVRPMNGRQPSDTERSIASRQRAVVNMCTGILDINSWFPTADWSPWVRTAAYPLTKCYQKKCSRRLEHRRFVRLAPTTTHSRARFPLFSVSQLYCKHFLSTPLSVSTVFRFYFQLSYRFLKR